MAWLTEMLNKHPELGVYLAMGIGFAIGRLRVREYSLGSVTGSPPSSALAEVRTAEARLNAGPARLVLPKERIAAVADSIHDGDVIAAASTVAGLDVVHTGFAVWDAGRLHLLHAPLKGSSVELSALPLAERILAIGTQRGIMVARPLPEGFGTASR